MTLTKNVPESGGRFSKEHIRKCKEVYDWNNSFSKQMTYLERLQYCRRFYLQGIEVKRYKPPTETEKTLTVMP